METQMILAAKKIFGLSEEAATLRLAELQSAPIAIVEYPNLLPGEDKRGYDNRRELIDVHTGKIKALVKYLIKLSKDKAQGLLPWEVIFTYYKQINPDIASRPMHDETSSVSESTEKRVEENEPSASVVVAEEKPTEIPSSSETSSEQVAATIEPTHSTTVEKPIKTNGKDSVINAEVRETGVDVSVNKPKQVTAQCDNNSFMEELKMSENFNSELMGIAEGLAGSTAPVAEKSDKKASTKPEKHDKSVMSEISRVFQSTVAERNNFIQNNHITMLIGTAPSVLDRLVSATGIKGKLAVATGDAAKADSVLAEKLTKKLNGLVARATGKKAMTYEDWIKLSPEEQYAAVVDVDENGNPTNVHKDMAKKMIELVVAAKANPAMSVDLAAPATKNVAYKGLEIGGQNYPKKEITTLIIDKANSSIFGEGMLDQQGVKTAAANDASTNVEVRLSIKKVSEGAQAGADGTAIATNTSQVKYKPTTVLKGRQVLIDQGKVAYLYPNVDKNEETTTPLTVLIDGKPATFKCYKCDDNGVRQSTKADKNGVTRLKTQVATLKGNGPVYKVVKELAAEYVGELALSDAAERWGVSKPVQNNDSEFIRDFNTSTVFQLFTLKNVQYGDIESTSHAKLQDIIEKKKAGEAAETAAVLDA